MSRFDNTNDLLRKLLRQQRRRNPALVFKAVIGSPPPGWDGVVHPIATTPGVSRWGVWGDPPNIDLDALSHRGRFSLFVEVDGYQGDQPLEIVWMQLPSPSPRFYDFIDLTKGYEPETRESPPGDARFWVSPKYLRQCARYLYAGVRMPPEATLDRAVLSLYAL